MENNNHQNQNIIQQNQNSNLITTTIVEPSTHTNGIIINEPSNTLNYLRSFPPGYKFDPTDEELIIKYLIPKINGTVLPRNLMHEVNIYNHHPKVLAENYYDQGNKQWYFFTSRERKYKNGTRPNRKAGDGYWKATGADRVIEEGGVPVGFRKSLVFYQGRPPNGVKSSWIMHEFRVYEDPNTTTPSKKRKKICNPAEDLGMRLDDHVLCRIYKKEDGNGKKVVTNDEVIVNEEAETSLVDNPINNNDNNYISSANSSPHIPPNNNSQVVATTTTTNIQPPMQVPQHPHYQAPILVHHHQVPHHHHHHHPNTLASFNGFDAVDDGLSSFPGQGQRLYTPSDYHPYKAMVRGGGDLYQFLYPQDDPSLAFLIDDKSAYPDPQFESS